MNKTPLTPAKAERLRKISNPAGGIAAVAMDQRSSLRRMIAAAAGKPENSIADVTLTEFKSAVTSVLTPHASAVLLDPEYGLDATREKSPACGLLLTYEADGFENPRPNRMLLLMSRFSVQRLKDLGADAIKILLSWNPEADGPANDEKRVWIERIGNECHALDIPFLLEPVTYDVEARRKPESVVRTLEEFSKPVYKVDVLKIEFPVIAGSPNFTQDEVLHWYRAADAAAQVPYVFLSAGITIDQFVGSLELAAEAGAHFSGVLCGRATWQDGVHSFVSGGRKAFEAWLAGDGVKNLLRIEQCLRAASSWEQRR